MKKRIFIRLKSFEIYIHLISWLLMFIFPLFLSDRSGNINWEHYYRHVVVTMGYCTIFYINYLYLIHKFWFNNRGILFTIINVLLLILLSGGIHYIQGWLYPRPEFIRPEYMHRPPRFLFHLPMVFVVVLSMIIRISQQWHEMRDKLIEAEREKSETELTNLKNQLNPHFLLNTLNNIYALININGTKAQEAVHELSKLLRYMLYDNETAYVPLAKELDFIYNYVSLMRIRLANSVEVSLKLDAGPREICISPLIFISLIENAFKHGISPTQHSFISISIQGSKDGKVTCEIMNSNHPKTSADKSGSGIGLEQVSRRLELLYPNKYEWHKGISSDGSTYTSILIIQTEEV